MAARTSFAFARYFAGARRGTGRRVRSASCRGAVDIWLVILVCCFVVGRRVGACPLVVVC
jgi:hypothetical protein